MLDREIKERIVKMRYGMEVGYGQEIVRCKDCVFRDNRDGMCEHVQQVRDPDWYCADVERKEGGEVE